MAKSLTELAADIVVAQASHAPMSPEDMTETLKAVFAALKGVKAMEEGAAGASSPTPEVPAVDPAKSILKNKVICLECGREFRMLTNRHLKEHGMTAKEYRKKYGFRARQSLSAKSLNAARRKNALERGLGDILKRARERQAEPAASVSQPAPAAKKVVRRRKKGEAGSVTI